MAAQKLIKKEIDVSPITMAFDIIYFDINLKRIYH